MTKNNVVVECYTTLFHDYGFGYFCCGHVNNRLNGLLVQTQLMLLYMLGVCCEEQTKPSQPLLYHSPFFQ